MKEGIHPTYRRIRITCVCGNQIESRSTIGKDFHIEICSNCHPFYTGRQKLVDSAGRVERFLKKYKMAPLVETADTADVKTEN